MHLSQLASIKKNEIKVRGNNFYLKLVLNKNVIKEN